MAENALAGTFDTAVLGAGAAGMLIALAAQARGQRVLLVEPRAGAASNFAISGGLFPAAGSRLQAAAGVRDRPEDWLQDLRATRLGGLLLGHGYQAADLVAYGVGALLAGCADVTFLRPSLPSPSGPDSLPDRSSRPTPGSGPAVHSENPR